MRIGWLYVYIGALATLLIIMGVLSVFGSPPERARILLLPYPTVGSMVAAVLGTETPKRQYIEVVDGCGPYFEDSCLNARSGPSVSYPSVGKLRKGVILEVERTVEVDGMTWYKIVFDEWLRYPERLNSDWYVAADYVRLFNDDGPQDVRDKPAPQTGKSIIVDRSEQMLYAYDGTELFMQVSISTGLELTPTPRGTFRVFRKTPSRYMQGPIIGISEKEYDLPGVPWNLYFTEQGAVIHGAYWHTHFGEPWSNGCVNMPPEKARELYLWAPLGTYVTVRD